ncbi:MAG: hypothetical protein H6Q68_3852 [Firmicutes bacterium]|nr:hypothetical protein [Bacillota bacterium]
MFLECTKKLADALKIRLFDITPLRREPFYEWHANLFVFNRRKGIIMMNNQTRYCVVLYGLKVEHFKNLRPIVLSAIEQIFLAEGFYKEVVVQYINHCGDVVFAKTHDRSIISQMNDMLYLTTCWIEDYLPTGDICMVDLSMKLGGVPVGSLKYSFPIDHLREAMNSEFFS